jgi:hypothetical protein
MMMMTPIGLKHVGVRIFHKVVFDGCLLILQFNTMGCTILKLK